MTSDKLKWGRLGEKIARNFLTRRGCQIIGQNFFTRFGEIDLIAWDGQELIFCEVKTRTNQSFGYPEEAVGSKKIKRLLKSAEVYLAQKEIENFWRLDVVAIEIDKERRRARVSWFKRVGDF